MKKIMAVCAALACAISASEVLAGPPLVFQTCPGVTRPSGTGLLLFDATCTSAYLLPGAHGRLTVTSAFFNITNESCSSVRELEKSALGTFGNAAERAQRKIALESELKQTREKILALETQVSQLRILQSAFNTASTEGQAKYTQLQTDFQTQCENNPNKSFVCLSLSSGLGKAQNAVAEASEKLNRVNAALNVHQQDLTKATDAETKLKQTVAALAPTAAPDELQKLAQAELAKLRKDQGAVITASLQTSLSDDLRRLQEVNPRSKITFEQARLNSGSIYAAGLDRGSGPETLGTATIEIPGASTVDNRGTLFANASGAKVTLDFVSACQAFEYKRPDTANLHLISQKMVANIAAKAYLKYNALLGVKITVKMNYARFYELIVSTNSRNGFFRTSTTKEISEKLRGENNLTIDIVDEGHVLTPEAKDALQLAMRERVIQRAFDLLNAKYVGVDPSAAPTTPQAGAPIAARELRKCANPWCQAGAAVIDVAHAIFGGNDSTQKFLQEHNVRSTEVYSNQDAFEFMTDLTFVPR